MSKLSILTVVKDGLEKLPDTLSSVADQSQEPYEHLICVGMPDDGSLKFLNKYKGHSIKVIKQNDKGLYDALNKAIQRAEGDYILFLHAGDKLLGRDFIKDFHDVSHCNAEVFYGNVKFYSNEIHAKRHWRSDPYKASLIHFGWMPPHTCSIVKRSAYIELGLFDTSFQISGDYDIFLKIMRSGKSFLYREKLTVEMEIGGVSTQGMKSQFRKFAEDFRAVGGRFYYALFVIIMKRLRKITQFL